MAAFGVADRDQAKRLAYATYMAPASASSEKSSAEHPQTDADCETTYGIPSLRFPF